MNAVSTLDGFVRGNRRRSKQPVVVLKFGGTTVGSPALEGRLELAFRLIETYWRRGYFVVPVFSAFRRGRGSDPKKVSVTDLLVQYEATLRDAPTIALGARKLKEALVAPHLELLDQLGLAEVECVRAALLDEIDEVVDAARFCVRSYGRDPSLRAEIVTAGERLSTLLLAAHVNHRHGLDDLPFSAARVTAAELGLYTDANFLSARIEYDAAREHAAEVLFGNYLERGVLPIVTGFDGIHDPAREFEGRMKDPRTAPPKHVRGVYRTALGRGGSDLTATFLGMSLQAEFIGFAKETPGVLTGDDMLVGDSAQTLPHLDYDLATEAGNIYPRAVAPARAGGIPIHIFDPASPESFTAIGPTALDPGAYLIGHPQPALHASFEAVPDEPGSLVSLLEPFAELGIDVAEVRHHRSGTDILVESGDELPAELEERLAARGMPPLISHVWVVRVVGNLTPTLARRFEEVVTPLGPLSVSGFDADARVLSATFQRNRARDPDAELERIRGIVRVVHDDFVVPNLGGPVAVAAPACA